MSITSPRFAMAWPLIECPFPLAATVRFGDCEAKRMTLAMSWVPDGRTTANGDVACKPPKSFPAKAVERKSMLPSSSIELETSCSCSLGSESLLFS
ncbi:hypothetical protein HanRHA438_Chr03g0109791 [Helianthus annuus]|nr:hypothetical protein HanIR_Chr03g0107731 [Helianthus annuus]KAJ0934649.1 hypothetical protein HanRHA438_Chr03g0109791 [Helianthus annuus]